MNMIQFNHFGEPLNAYFTLSEKGNLTTLKVTRGSFKDEGFDLTEEDVAAIQDEIQVEVYLTTQEFESRHNMHQA
jgi:hypothetical protein